MARFAPGSAIESDRTRTVAWLRGSRQINQTDLWVRCEL